MSGAAGWAERLDRVARRVAGIVEGVLFGLLALISLLAFTQVVLRYVFNRAFFWADELTLAAFTWLIFLSAARVLERRGHFGVEALVRRLPRPLRHGVAVGVHLLMLAVVAFLFWFGLEHARGNWGQESDVLRVPMTFWYAVLPLATGLMALALVRDLLTLVAGRDLRPPEDLG